MREESDYFLEGANPKAVGSKRISLLQRAWIKWRVNGSGKRLGKVNDVKEEGGSVRVYVQV